MGHKQPLTKRLALDKPAEIDKYFKAAIKVQALPQRGSSLARTESGRANLGPATLVLRVAPKLTVTTKAMASRHFQCWFPKWGTSWPPSITKL